MRAQRGTRRAGRRADNRNGPSGNGGNNLLIAAVAWKQTAAEYRALYHQAFNLARMRLDQALAARKPATSRWP